MAKLPSGVDIDNLIDDLRIIGWEASNTLLYYSQILKDSSNKSNILKNDNIEDPVTVADLKVNDIIIQNINEKYKDIDWHILSEENVKEKTNNCDISSEWLWVLDPLDGTKDFIQGTTNYAMHLALNHNNKSYIGLVLIPERDELWFSNGEKVWCERKDRSIYKPKLSKNSKLEDMTIVTSKNHRNGIIENLIDKANFKNVITMGSIGCKITSILRGESDIYISVSLPGESYPKDWDFAAPDSLLKASGGLITNLDNEEIKYGKPNFNQAGIIIATNNYKLHSSICSQIKEIVKKHKLFPFSSF